MTKKGNTVELKRDPNQSEGLTLAQFKTKSSFMNAPILGIYEHKVDKAPFDLQETINSLEITIKEIGDDDLSAIESILISQAKSLEAIFANSIIRANKCEYMQNYEAHMHIALKAQNQSRSTLQTLIQLKQPNQTTFVKQANISQGHQQVNNHSEKNLILQNKLLEANQNGCKKVDRMPKKATKRVDSSMEAMDKIDRSQDA